MASPDRPQRIESKELLGKAEVTALYSYPLKSAQGIELQTAEVNARGIAHDREYMVVAGESFRNRQPGDFISRREVPFLGHITPTITDNSLQLWEGNIWTLELPFDQDGKEVDVRIRKDSIRAIDQGDRAAKWLRDTLGVDVRLVKMAPDHVRQAGSHRLRDTDQTALSDGYPFHLTAQESLDRFNGNFRPTELSMQQFRPNIVIEGLGFPYAEDLLQTIRIGDVEFDVVKPSPRCVIINQSPYGFTPNRIATPLNELARIRTAEIKPGEKGAIFGQNLVHRNEGTVSVCDVVNVLKIQEGPQFVNKKQL